MRTTEEAEASRRLPAPGLWCWNSERGTTVFTTDGAEVARTVRMVDARLIALTPDLLAALKSLVEIAEEAAEEWDKAPSGMRAGKILLALAGHVKGYRQDTDKIHALIAQAEGRA